MIIMLRQGFALRDLHVHRSVITQQSSDRFIITRYIRQGVNAKEFLFNTTFTFTPQGVIL